MKKTGLKKLTALVLALCICGAMAGCGDSAEKKLEDALESISEKDIDDAAKDLGLDDGGSAKKADSSEAPAEPMEFDPFEYLEITYEGKAPYVRVGKLKVNNPSDKPYKKLSFRVDDSMKDKNLANGDTVKIIAEITEKEGCTPSKTEMEYTVEGADEYLMKLDELPDDVNEKYKKQADDMLTSETSGFNEWVEVKSTDFLGNYLLTIKTDGDYGYGNRLYYIYKVSILSHNKDADGNDKEDSFDYIFAVYIDDTYKLNDGTWVVDASNMKAVENTISKENGISINPDYFKGYENMDSFFSNEIAVHSSDSLYETNIK